MLVESYITDQPVSLKSIDGVDREYPAGTWIVTTKLTDPDEIQKDLNGDYEDTVLHLSVVKMQINKFKCLRGF